MDKPALSKRAFQGVDLDKIDYDKNALYVLENVMNNGSLDDFITLKKFYGDHKIRETIIHSKELGPKEVNFCCLVFDLNLQDFQYPTIKAAYPNNVSYGA